MVEKFTNLVKKIAIQIQEGQNVPNKINPKRPAPRHTIIKMPNVKDKENVKSNKRKAISITGNIVILLGDFSAETLQASSRESRNTFSDERIKPTTKNTLSNRVVIQN